MFGFSLTLAIAYRVASLVMVCRLAGIVWTHKPLHRYALVLVSLLAFYSFAESFSGMKLQRRRIEELQPHANTGRCTGIEKVQGHA